MSGRGGQNRARGRHLKATNMLSAFSRFKQRGEGGGGCCPLSADTTGGVGAVCLLSANSTSGWRGGGGGGAVRFWLIQPAGEGGGCCLSAFG